MTDADRLRDVVRTVERSLRDNECPSCKNMGCHKPDCKLKELLG